MAEDVNTEPYLGDGLYASFDGYQVKLRAPRGMYEDDHVVYLEPAVLRAFKVFVTEKVPLSCQ